MVVGFLTDDGTRRSPDDGDDFTSFATAARLWTIAVEAEIDGHQGGPIFPAASASIAGPG